MKKIKIALLGSLPKGDKTRLGWKDWKQDYIKTISKLIPDASFIHGDLISDNIGPELVVGHDLWLIKNSDIIVVNAESKIGAGTAQEMIMAKLFERPVFSVLPKDSHHRKSNIAMGGVEIEDWIHPFIFCSSDFIAENTKDLCIKINDYLKNKKSCEIKTIGNMSNLVHKFEQKHPEIVQKYRKYLV